VVCPGACANPACGIAVEMIENNSKKERKAFVENLFIYCSEECVFGIYGAEGEKVQIVIGNFGFCDLSLRNL